jgi:hypothetical protein
MVYEVVYIEYTPYKGACIGICHDIVKILLKLALIN